MEITYRMTFGEILGVIFYKLPRTFGFIVSMGGLAGVLLSQFLRMSGTSFSLQEKIIRLIVIFLPTSLIPILFGVLVVAVLQYKSPHDFLQTKRERILSLSESGLLNKIANKASEVKWADVTKVNRTNKYIFLHLSDCLAFAIPNRAFRSKENADSYYGYAYQHWKGRSNT